MTSGGRRTAGAARWADRVEIGLMLLTGYAAHLYYNLIGHIASLRGVDYGPLLLTPLDRRLPYIPVLVHFYQIAYFVPAAVLIGLLWKLGADTRWFRRVWGSFLALLALHYALYLLLPTSARAVRLEDAAIGGGLIGDLVRAQYRLATVWCAWPSLHVSACWFFFRLLVRHAPAARWPYLVWFSGMFLGTAGIRIHYLLDGVTGLLLAEAVHRLVLLPRERKVSGPARGPGRGVRLALLAGLLALLVAGLPLLMEATGFEGPLYTIGDWGL